MLGAMIGDLCGSIYERRNIRHEPEQLENERCRFTDDSVLTLAVYEHLSRKQPLVECFKTAVKTFPDAGWGGNFVRWAVSTVTEPYGSYGNGSAMRVSPVLYFSQTLDEALDLAKRTAEVTHDHPEGIKGAQATVAAIWLARQKKSPGEIREAIRNRFGYALDRTIDQMRPTYVFDVSGPGSVPHAIQAFLESGSFEETIKRAISLGGDSDTIACIAGAMAEAAFGVEPQLRHWAFDKARVQFSGKYLDLFLELASRSPL